MTIRKNLFLLPALLLLILSACQRVPPFNGQLAYEYQVKQQFDLVAKIGPVKQDRYEFSEDDTIHFIPDLDNPETGFLLILNEYGGGGLSYLNADRSLSNDHGISISGSGSHPQPLITLPLDGAGDNKYLFLINYYNDDSRPFATVYRYAEGGIDSDNKLNLIWDQDVLEAVRNDFNNSGYPNWAIDENLGIAGLSVDPGGNRLYICTRYENAGMYEYFECDFYINSENGLTDGIWSRENNYAERAYPVSNQWYFFQGSSSILVYQDEAGSVYMDRWSVDGSFNYTDDATVTLESLYTNRLAMGYYLTNTRDVFILYDEEHTVLQHLDESSLLFEYEKPDEDDVINNTLLFSSYVEIDDCCDDDQLFLYVYAATVSGLQAIHLD